MPEEGSSVNTQGALPQPPRVSPSPSAFLLSVYVFNQPSAFHTPAHSGHSSATIRPQV